MMKDLSNKLPLFLWFLYYSILMIVLVSWQNIDPPPLNNRLFFLAATIVPPIIFSKTKLIPVVIILFFTVNLYGTSLSYYPTYTYYYLGVVLFGLFFIKKQDSNRIKLPVSLVYLFVLIFFVDFISSYEVLDIFYCFIIVFIISYYYSNEDVRFVKYLQYVFVVSSFVLSIEYFTIGKEYVQLYAEGIEREYWMDPNYFATVTGMGIVNSILMLMDKEKKHWLAFLFLVATIILSFLTLVLVASRGALLATVISITFYLLVSNTKWYIKIIIVAIALFSVFYMYNNNYFELIEQRVLGGDTTGSGRTSIWKRKLRVFSEDSNPLHFIWGLGNTGAVNLAYDSKRGLHNDFISFLISYGIIGFSFFIATLVKPILTACVYKKEVITGIMYLAACCMTLEPITSGYLPYFGFYFCFVLMSQVKKK